MNRNLLRGLGCLVLVLSLSACGTAHRNLYLESGYDKLPQKKFAVRNIDFGEDYFDYDAVGLYQEELTKRLESAGLLAGEETPKADALYLDTFLIEYDPGNLLDRWVVGYGAGDAYTEVVVNIVDGRNEEVIGVVHVQNQIHCCGLLSAGAEEKVIKESAMNLVKNLKKNKKVPDMTPADLDLRTKKNMLSYSDDNFFGDREDSMRRRAPKQYRGKTPNIPQGATVV